MKEQVLLALSLGVAALITLPGAGIGVETWSKTWVIAVGHDWGAAEYIDTDGYIRGFTRDLIAEVCEAGNMQCRTVWDKYTNCWNSNAGQHSYGGVGLMSGWYDACTGWVGSVNRMQVFDFSLPFLQPSKSYFYINKGDTFNVYDIQNVKLIGFLDGWVNDEKCLARQGMINGSSGFPAAKVKHYLTNDDALKALKARKIDAIFAGEYQWNDDNIVTAQNTFFTCASSGNGMMTRKDNDFNQAWNMGFQQIQASGRFAKLCQESAQAHAQQGSLLPCV